MPRGHVMTLKSIRTYVNDDMKVANTSAETSIDAENEKIKRKLYSVSQKYTRSIELEKTRELNVLKLGSGWIIQCPYCDKDIGATVTERRFVASNFKSHLDSHRYSSHRQSPQVSEPESESSENESTTRSSPPPKRRAVNTSGKNPVDRNTRSVSIS